MKYQKIVQTLEKQGISSQGKQKQIQILTHVKSKKFLRHRYLLLNEYIPSTLRKYYSESNKSK